MKKIPSSRIFLYAILLIVTVCIMLTLRNCRNMSAGRLADASTLTDTIDVAIQYAPGSFYMQGDTLGGVDYDALRSLGLPYRIFPITNPAEGLDGLNKGRYDVVIADLPQTSDSASKYIFTDPVYLDRQVLVQRKNPGRDSVEVKSVLDLAGDTVCVPANSPMVARLRNLAHEIGADIRIDEHPVTSERLLMELAHGTDGNGRPMRYAVVNEFVAREMAIDYPQLDFSVPVSMTQFQPWVLRKSDLVLRNDINRRLREL